MILLLLSLFSFVAVEVIPEGSIPLSLALWLGGGFVGVVGVLFRMLIATTNARFTEMARVTENLAADSRRAWGIVDRVTQTRVLEIGAFPHVSPQIRQEAKRVCDEISEAQADEKRREMP